MILFLQSCYGSKFDTHCARFVSNIRAVPDQFKKKSLKSGYSQKRRLVSFGALWRPNEAPYQHKRPYFWNVHYIFYPLTYKSLYKVLQITELFDNKDSFDRI